jgi:hypothetical protein
MEYHDQNQDPDLDLFSSERSSPSIALAEPHDTPARWPKIAAAALIVMVVAASGYFLFRNRAATVVPATAAATPPAPAAPAAAAAPLGAEAPAIDLPPLDESDDVVRGLVKELSKNPSVVAWLASDNLIRNFVVAVSNIAAGEPAAPQVVRTLRPRGTFQTEDRGEDVFVNPRSYARYLSLATAAGSAPPDQLAKLYTMLKPRIDDAYGELGQPNTTFDQTFERAIVVLLKTPIPQGRVALAPHGPVLYGFADPALEKLSPVQKALIRFGPENQRSVQTSLRNIALALGIPADRLPQPQG